MGASTNRFLYYVFELSSFVRLLKIQAMVRRFVMLN